MKPKTLANKIIKAHYGKFSVNKGTCKCMEVCVEQLGIYLYKQFTKRQWQIDLNATDAIDVQLYKIGKKSCQ